MDNNNSAFSNEEPNLYKTLTKKRADYNSVQNIKDEVVLKRNEIMEKIEHCQNLLNTIMREKQQYMNSRNYDINDYKNTHKTYPYQSPSASLDN